VKLKVEGNRLWKCEMEKGNEVDWSGFKECLLIRWSTHCIAQRKQWMSNKAAVALPSKSLTGS
jgi:hypothetical protein